MTSKVDKAVLSDLFDELFPICRSITGQGFRDSVNILARILPLETKSIASGTKVFDWTVPPEWVIRKAVLTDPSGKTVVDFKNSNLHVLNYSEPVDLVLSLEQLQPHLHSLEHLPSAIPYVTSYYKRNWGFCLTHEQRQRLQPGNYHARIDSELRSDGELNFADYVLPGESDQEVLLSSYFCHPSLANNELSGPLVLAGLYDRISRWKRRRYSYRFLINPETIGSLCYLHEYGDHLKSKLAGGLVLTCLGGNNAHLSYKTSRQENCRFDRLVECLNQQEDAAIEIRPFSPLGGSDERQFCSPGFNLPVGQFARDVYGQYDGYHNSLDDKDYMDIDKVEASIDTIEHFLRRAEIAGNFTNQQPYGEPQLGPRGLYPNLNVAGKKTTGNDDGSLSRAQLDQLRYILSYSDGQHTMMSIADKAGCTLAQLEPVIEKLEHTGLLRL